MKSVKLGHWGPRVSEICFGSLAVSPLQGRVSEEEGREVFRYACAQGIDWVDTAEIYGNYEQLAPVLAEFPHVRVVSKSYAVTAEEMERSLAMARKGLGRDVIDFFLLHEQEGLLTLRGHEAAWQRLRQAQREGEVGWIGISTHTVKGVREGCLFPGMQIIHPILNYAGVGIVGGGVEEMLSALGLAHEVGMGIYAMKVFGGGHLGGVSARPESEGVGGKAGESGQPQEREQPHGRGYEKEAGSGNEKKLKCRALDFVMGIEDVPAMALGMSSCAEVDFNVRYVSGLAVETGIADQVGRVERRLHVADWCEGCGRCMAYCPSQALSLTEGAGAEKAVGTGERTCTSAPSRVRVDRRRCVLCGYCGRGCPHFCLKIV